MIGLFLMIAFIALIAGCVEVSELEYIEFETYPKTTYLVVRGIGIEENSA